ncbi:MAG: hypothetical protein IKM46_06805 [Clostridia bacterium]|nr:hypothetical protein [Clostridia bacterium]
MVKFDYSYYCDVFGGKAGEDEFSRYAPSAFDVISLLIGRDAEGFTEPAVLRALAAEVDHLISNAQTECGITKESLGDYSVSYGKAGTVAASSLPVSSEAVTALTRAGLITRWA